jgi:hypothetical protein
MRLRRVVAPLILIPLAAVAWPSLSHAQAPSPATPAQGTEPPPPPEPSAAQPPPPPVEPPPPPRPLPPSTFVSPGGDWKFGFHGLVGVSLYIQDTPTFVLNGQGPLLPLSKPGGGSTTGADIRQSRFNFSVAGPKVLGGATPKAVLEIDLFGLNGPGGYGEVSAYSRVRLGYAELNWGNDVLRFGQDHNLILGVLPESIGHQAYPVTYFNGLIGWREPGIGYFHTIPLGESKLELALQLNKSDWENPTDFGDSTVNDLNVDYGQLSGWLGAEARVKYTSEHVMGFVAGHYNHVEGSHAGDLVAPPMTIPNRNWDVEAGVVGVKVTGAGFTVAANAYDGKNLGPLLGALLQFPGTNDVAEWGGWIQAGYAITSHFNVSAIGGTSRPKASDISKAVANGGLAPSGRSANSVIGGMVRYQEGGFAIGPEYYHVIAKDILANGTGAPSGAGAPNGVIDVNQFMMSGVFFF